MRRLHLFCFWLTSLAASITLHAFDLDAYRTVKTAIPSEIQESAVGKSIANGYLGVSVDEDASGALRIEEVALESPAEKSGLKPGDLILALDGGIRGVIPGCSSATIPLESITGSEER